MDGEGGPPAVIEDNNIWLILSQPDALKAICKHISNGGDLITWAANAGIKCWDDVAEWIDADPVRQRKYELALIRREAWMREKVVAELARIGTSNLTTIFDDKGNMKPIFEWPMELAGAIQQIELVEIFEGVGKARQQIGWTRKIKFWDKVKALELVGKHLAMFADRVEHTGTVKLEDLILNSGAPAGDDQDS